MAPYDFRSPRLYVDVPLAAGAAVTLGRQQSHYLAHVMRLGEGDRVLAFNGRDGEWSSRIETAKRSVILRVGDRTRAQSAAMDLHYLFAPLKAARLDYMTQKAVEMGASLLQPLLTRHGQVSRVNTQRMRANTIEAAEQCGILAVPAVEEPVAFDRYLAARDTARWLIFCDEDAEAANPATVLGKVPVRSPLALLIGPEGGFAADERAALLEQNNVVRLSLGPRILRADTAAVAALAVVQAVVGDWR